MKITGNLFRDMVISGANSIENHKEEVNNLNVYPVPDGDTGLNMSMTIGNAKKSLDGKEYQTIGECAKETANLTLRGARGNSGVITAMFFRGLSKFLEGYIEIGTDEFVLALRKAVDEAYKAVMTPTEGTILTVMRMMTEDAEKDLANGLYKDDNFDALFTRSIESAKKALAITPELLPVLKQANVVDSGGKGFIYIFIGMYKALSGEIVEAVSKDATTNDKANFADFEDEDITFTYCTECIIDKNDTYKGEGKAREFYDTIAPTGDSVVFVDDEEIIKVHIHTDDPGFVFTTALKFGALSTVKVENMRIQHTSMVENETKPKVNANVAPRKKYGFVAVCNGDGIQSTFADLGVDAFVKGGQSLNPSTEQVLEAIEKTNADIVYILPNNSNIIMVAEQAKNVVEDRKVYVVPSKTMPQGIASLVMFDPDDDEDINYKQMLDSMTTVESLAVTKSVRDSEIDGLQIKEGDYLGLKNGKITIVEKTSIGCLEKLIDTVKESEILSVFYGCDVSEETAEEAFTAVKKASPDAEASILYGGQPLYDYIVMAQ